MYNSPTRVVWCWWQCMRILLQYAREIEDTLDLINFGLLLLLSPKVMHGQQHSSSSYCTVGAVVDNPQEGLYPSSHLGKAAVALAGMLLHLIIPLF